MKKIFTLLAVSSCCVLANATTAFTYEGINYVVDDHVAFVASNADATGDVVIPAVLSSPEGLCSVRSISASAFKNAAITSISIPSSVTAIGDSAFYKTSIRELTIPENVKEIGACALFINNLSSLTINSQYYCNHKHKVSFAESFGTANSDVSKVCFGPNVTSISDSAFYYYDRDYPNYISSVGVVDFSNVKTISGPINIFKEYETMYIDKDIEDMSEAEFTYKEADDRLQRTSKVKDLIFKGNVSASILGGTVLDRFTGLEKVEFIDIETLPSELCTSSNANMFYLNKDLKEIILPSNLKKIGNLCFEKLSLSKINLPDGLKTIGIGAFSENKALEKIVLPNTLTSVPAYCFSDCTNLQSVVIPEGIVSIGDGAFANCSSLLMIELPSTLKECDANVFSGSADNLKYMKDLARGLWLTPSNPSCVVVTATESRAQTYRNIGIETVFSLESLQYDKADLNRDGELNTQDVMELYDAIKKQ